MTGTALFAALERIAETLRHDHGVNSLHVLGSVARGDERPDSDVGLLVDFDGPVTFARFMALTALLEDTLGRPVDLVTRRALRERMRPSVEAEARRVA